MGDLFNELCEEVDTGTAGDEAAPQTTEAVVQNTDDTLESATGTPADNNRPPAKKRCYHKICD